MNIIKKVKAALEGERAADELDELAAALQIHTNEGVKRFKAITAKDTSTFSENPGPERQKVIDAGDVAVVRQLDDEERDLAAELVVLRVLQKRLRAHLDDVRAREFVEAAPLRYTELAKLLAAESNAQAALQAARKETESALNNLNARRQHVARPNTPKLEFPAADETLLIQLMKVRGYAYYRGPTRVGWFSPTDGPQQLKIVAAALGVKLPHPDRESVAA